jgi:hypothetical protein
VPVYAGWEGLELSRPDALDVGGGLKSTSTGNARCGRAWLTRRIIIVIWM